MSKGDKNQRELVAELSSVWRKSLEVCGPDSELTKYAYAKLQEAKRELTIRRDNHNG